MSASVVVSSHQVKELSDSELDLHKPKRFATLSFALKKKRKKYEDSLSKSTCALHVPEAEESSAPTVSSCPPCPAICTFRDSI